MVECLPIPRRTGCRGRFIPAARALVRRKGRVGLAADEDSLPPPVPATITPLHVVCPPMMPGDVEMPRLLAAATYAENLPGHYEFEEFLPIRPVNILV